MKINIVKNQNFRKYEQKPLQICIQHKRSMSFLPYSRKELKILRKKLKNQLKTPLSEKEIQKQLHLISQNRFNVALNPHDHKGDREFVLIYLNSNAYHTIPCSRTKILRLVRKLRKQSMNPINEDVLYQEIEEEF